MRSTNVFLGLKEICDLGEKLVETKKDKVYPLVYLLVTLALFLPVATAGVKRVLFCSKYIEK